MFFSSNFRDNVKALQALTNKKKESEPTEIEDFSEFDADVSDFDMSDSPNPEKEAADKNNNKSSMKDKMKIVLVVILLFILFGLFYYIFISFVSSPTPPSTQKVAQETTQTEPTKKSDAVKEPVNVSGPIQNPFVDISALRNSAQHSNASGAQQVPMQSAGSSSMSYPRPNIPLPAIPGTGYANTTINRPAMPAAMTATPPANTNGIAGVITSDDGSNMAITQDGQVLSEGDRFNDGRIAYIGGDGIQLDNGSSIQYK